MREHCKKFIIMSIGQIDEMLRVVLGDEWLDNIDNRRSERISESSLMHTVPTQSDQLNGTSI